MKAARSEPLTPNAIPNWSQRLESMAESVWHRQALN